jgi:predicted AAA+ superfamily ATPase
VITPYSIALPIEVKYQNDIGNSDLRGLTKFDKKFGSKIALIVTKNELDIQESIVKIPAWLYLIMC